MFLPNGFAHVRDGTARTVGFGEAFYFSTSTQSLLGQGDYYPVTDAAKVITTIQALLTAIVVGSTIVKSGK